MLTDNKEGLILVDAKLDGRGAEVAVCHPDFPGVDALLQLAGQRALLHMSVPTRHHIHCLHDSRAQHRPAPATARHQRRSSAAVVPTA